MKKLILFTYILSIISYSVFSQNLSLLFNGSPISSDTTIQVSGPYNTTIDFAGIVVKNNSTGSLSIKAKKVIIDTIAGTTNTICFGVSCYPPTTYVTPAAVVIAGGATDATFIAHYSANSRAGNSHIRYVFFDTNNTNDSISVIANYDAINNTGINELNGNDVSIRDAYPNPSNNYTTFNYSLPKQTTNAKITLRNLLGSEVLSANLDELNGKKTISTADLKEGIYFYSLIVNDKIYYTRKLVVRH